MFMHLTNFSLNKKNAAKFKVAGSDFADLNSTASKQLMTTVFKKLDAKGCDTHRLKRKIESLAAKTVIALEPYIKSAYHANFMSSSNPRCFQILGLDILVDEALNCWLMEVNANPSLNVFNEPSGADVEPSPSLSEIDMHVKAGLITDTLALLSSAPLYS